MAILSIQSRVTTGYVGNAAAVPILQRLGREVWPIDTVVFSNHPAHGPFTGGVRPAAEVAALADGVEARGCFRECAALLSGYLGSRETGPVVCDVADRVRHAAPDAIWCCDPVMGDNGRFYVADGIPAFFRDRALAAADIVTPNAFEAAFLTGIEIRSIADAMQAAEKLRRAGPAMAVVTGVREDAAIAAVAVTGAGCWQARAPYIDRPAHGAGDAFASLFLGDWLHRRDVGAALDFAVRGVHLLLDGMAGMNKPDLPLVEMLESVAALR